MAKQRYRISSRHSVALDGGRMCAPGSLVNVDPSKSEHDQALVDDGVLVLEASKPRGGSAKRDTMPSEVANEETDGA